MSLIKLNHQFREHYAVLKAKLKICREDFIAEMKTIWEKSQNLTETNWQLALYHYNQMNLDDAILRCRIVLFLTPKKHQALYLLGRCYYEKYKLTKARIYLEKYLASNDAEWRAEAQYSLQVIKGEYKEIKEIPPRIMISNFNRIANFFDVAAIADAERLQHESAFALLNQVIQHSAKPLGNSLLDIGCGVGLFGELCRSARIASNIVGVDFSANMNEHTRQLIKDGVHVYTQLHLMTVEEFFASHDSALKYDIFSACDFLTYYPKAGNLFKAAQQCATEKAYFVFSFKTTDAEEIKFAEIIEQFFINPQYVIAEAQNHGWNLLNKQEMNYAEGVPGIVLLFDNQGVKLAKEESNV